MLTILKRSFRAPENMKEWLFNLDMDTRERQPYFSMPEGFNRSAIYKENWYGRVDRNTGSFELQKRFVGLFKTRVSRIEISGEPKGFGMMEISYRLTWDLLLDLMRPLFLTIMILKLTHDWTGPALIGCLVALEILSLVLEYNQIQEHLDDSFHFSKTSLHLHR